MDTENINETVGLGQAIDKVADLARAAEAGAVFVPIPKSALPADMVVDQPHLLVITDGKGQVEVEPYAAAIDALRGKPARRKGTATATTLDSFIALVNRNGDDGSVVFVDATWTAPKLTAVLNYHVEPVHDADIQPAAVIGGEDVNARFGDHRVVYAFPLSESWKAWVGQDGKWMKQAEFAAFLEEHVHELAVKDTDPDGFDLQWEEKFRTKIAAPNELVDLAQGLEVMVGARMKSKVRLASGETSMVFETEHKDAQGNSLTVPGLFLLSIPIFYRGLPQKVLVRLRYRPAGGDGIMWGYQIFRPDEVVDERIRRDVEEVAAETGRTVIHGAPESDR